MTKILFSSVCKPIGPSVGDTTSVGYELLHGQVTRSQGIYSPRVVHKQFALDYIAENLDAPSTVLHYPAREHFIKELKKGPEIVGISFVLSTAHHMIEMCALVREYAPGAKIVLGGYGTVMDDDELTPHCDAICREEGVGFMRRYLGEEELPVEKFTHPELTSRLRIFGIPIAHTAMIFAGLGCPNGCDFCATSHFFRREHIKLLATGDAIYETMESFQSNDPDCEFTILDEDFLLNEKRARRFLQLCREKQRSFPTFCFASVRALSKFTYEELHEMGIDGIWVGYEGRESGYDKHHGRDIDELIRDLQAHGISVLTSMIVGIPYQTAEIARKEFRGLMEDKPSLSQFLIYGPTPGTPFYEKVVREGLLRDEMLSDRAKYYKSCTGFKSMVNHPFMPPEDIEALQEEFYREDFRILGPSIFRMIDVKLNGYLKYKDSENPMLRKKAAEFRDKLAKYLAVLPVGIVGPQVSLKNRLLYLKRYFQILFATSFAQKAMVLAAPIMLVAAAITFITRLFNFGEHPVSRYHHYFGRKSMQKPVKLATTLYNLLHVRRETTCIPFWRKLSWRAIMSLRLSPKLWLPRRDALEDWMRRARQKLQGKGFETDGLDEMRTQIYGLHARFDAAKRRYKQFKAEVGSRSREKLAELKSDIKAAKAELKRRIVEMRLTIRLAYAGETAE
ncbi:MAG: radical SAM protein [Planctomycetes bacterium]|nr:radical SAM protein [Planctomycetota bacterium]